MPELIHLENRKEQKRENKEDGRGREIRTPNTRIWNPVLYQLELYPCNG